MNSLISVFTYVPVKNDVLLIVCHRDLVVSLTIASTFTGKRRGPPICYRPKQPAVDPLPSDGTMTFTVMRQLKESVEVQNQLRLDGKLCEIGRASCRERV